MSTEATITIVERPIDAPLLVSFPQGVPDTASGIKFSILKRKQNVLVKTNHNSIYFKGTNFGEHSSKKNCHQYAVAVFNPKTNELKLHPCNHPFILRPQVETTVEQAKLSISSATRRETLTNEFGSKKKKRALQAAKSNTISAENISGATELESNLFADVREVEAKADLIEAAEKIIQKSKKKSRG